MESFHAVESISCHIKAFIWDAGVGWMSSPWSRYSYSCIIFWSWLNVKRNFIVLCDVRHCKNKVVYHVILMFICWSQCLAEESVYKQDIVYYCHCLTKLIMNSIPVVHLFAEMLWLQSKKRVSLALNSYMCPKCRHLLIQALPFTVGWRSLVTWPNILHVYWTFKAYLKWLLKLKH